MFRLFFSHLQANMEPEFRYIKCAPNGISLRLQNNSLFNIVKYEGWNFNSGNYLFTTDTK